MSKKLLSRKEPELVSVLIMGHREFDMLVKEIYDCDYSFAANYYRRVL